MRRFLVLLLSVAFLSSLANICQGSSGGVPSSTPQKKTYTITPRKGKDAQADKISREEEAAQQRKEEELKRKRALTKKKKDALNDTSWDVELTPSSGQGKKLNDMIIFAEGKVYTENLIKENFLPTNYTITVEDSGKVIWETMQSNGTETIFIRGELDPSLKQMKGIMSQQRLEGTKDYSFLTIVKESYVPQQMEEEKAEEEDSIEQMKAE
ncbi:MAG: hypothetical protein JW867_04390 [Candidatus Omnitrophica bacterium]|nr:hypothetical protein [Candidatus Omnitrophota bacterium]